jgi:hypothetical protein
LADEGVIALRQHGNDPVDVQRMVASEVSVRIVHSVAERVQLHQQEREGLGKTLRGRDPLGRRHPRPVVGCRGPALRAKRSLKPQGTGRFGNSTRGLSKRTSAYD